MKRSRPRGFTLLELVIVACLMAVLAGVLLTRVLDYQEQAERVAREQVLAALRSALRLRLADLLIQRRQHEIPALAGQNPMTWLERAPANYAGEFYPAAAADLARGTWYFDRRAKVLVYLLRNTADFPEGKEKRLLFKVKLLKVKANPADMTGMQDAIEMVALEQVLQ